ncbi:MAG: hypothetical protein QF441_08140 [Bacteriovoracaceae bacterium]|jgi:hypothetical protein|nr:hypothetical protein [Bacteriovoracaceae bacterium]
MKKLFLLTILTVSTCSFALDVITFPIQMLSPCSKPRAFRQYAHVFCFTIKATDDAFGNRTVRPTPYRIISYFLSLPFMILDEKDQSLSLDAEQLLDQGYTIEELGLINQDFESIKNKLLEHSGNDLRSEQEIIHEMKDLSELTKDLIGL